MADIAGNDLWKYEFIFNSTNDLISLIDRNYVYCLVNDAYGRIYGKPREMILGRTVEEVWGPKVFRRLIRDNFNRCFLGQNVHDQDWIECGPQGLRFMDIAYHPFRNGEGEVTGAVVISRDITSLKRTEEDLRERERIYRALVENSLDGIIQTDLNGDILFLNPVAERLFQPNKSIMTAVYREDLDRVRLAWSRLAAGECLKNFELRVMDCTDRIVYLSCNATLIRDGERGTSSILAVGQDVTARRWAEVTMQEAHLTPREREIFLRVIQGYTNLNIAHQLEISEATVKYHLTFIFKKTHTMNRTELSALAFREVRE